MAFGGYFRGGETSETKSLQLSLEAKMYEGAKKQREEAHGYHKPKEEQSRGTRYDQGNPARALILCYGAHRGIRKWKPRAPTLRKRRASPGKNGRRSERSLMH